MRSHRLTKGMEMERECRNCEWYTEKLSRCVVYTNPEGFGECRRRAPIGPFVIASQVSKTKTVRAIINPFCTVAADDWCGEFKAKVPSTGE